MDMAMKPQTSAQTTEMPSYPPPTNTPYPPPTNSPYPPPTNAIYPPPTTTPTAPLAHNAHVDHVPRLLRWVQSFIAGMIIALSIGAIVGFENLLSYYDLVGGGGYVGALVIAIIAAVYTIILLATKPVPARLIAEYVAIALWLLAAVFLAAESAIVMNRNCYGCIYIYGAGPNAGATAVAFGVAELGLFCYTAYRGRQMRKGGVGREMGGGHV